MSERTVTTEDIEREHLAEVRPGYQAAYLFGVLAGGLAGMLALIAVLAAA